MIKNNKVYDTLKFIAQIFLPAVGALYFALSQIWGFPNGSEVVGTIVAVDTCLGVVLGISSTQYDKSEEKFDGTATVVGDKLRMNVDPSDFVNQKQVLLKVENPQN